MSFVLVPLNSSSYKGREKHGNLGGKHWWFGPGCIAKYKANYLIWYPAYSGHQWVPINRQNLVGIKGDTVCSSSVLRGKQLAAGIQDQSWDDMLHPMGVI
eukprot:512075-Ditylum_brightwellii.AAC.1